MSDLPCAAPPDPVGSAGGQVCPPREQCAPTPEARGPRVHPLLDALLAGDRRAECVTTVRELPPRAGRHSDWPAWADASIVAGYRALGIDRPWRHQAEAADALWSGRHVALATSTGSGKSLAFWLAALSAVRADKASGVLDPGRVETVARHGSVLYICPTKALAADQLEAVRRLLDACGVREIRVATCDGDTGREERRWVREHADVVLTNPDFLHFSMLPGHRQWSRFLRDLRLVVVDEGHAYRGVFGAHVALVLRRLRRLAGGEPTFAVASATTAEPAATAARLIGVRSEDIVTVDADGSPAGRRTVALWEPPVVAGFDPPDALSPDDPAFAAPRPEHPRRSATAEAADLLTDLVIAGARTLAFTRSRRGAEAIATQTREHLAPISSALVAQVAAYRGGYLPEERRALERELRSGELRGLATTNALELGVDISGLDAVLIAGWPGTLASWWQQAGRAGRAGAEGLVAFVAREDPLDTYLVHHPEAVFDAPLEATVFDPSNPYVLAPHLCAAAAESPLRTADLAQFGDEELVRGLLESLVARGALRRRPSGWYWTHTQSAAGMTDLRGSGGRAVQIVEASTGRLLGTIGSAAADASVHDGAVYVHQGTTYVVDHLALDDGVALAHRAHVDYGTWSRTMTAIGLADSGQGEVRDSAADRHPDRSRSWGPVEWGYGPVEVTSQVVSFQRRRLPDMQILGTETLDLPERCLPTKAVWWTVPDEVLTAAEIAAEAVPGALHAAEHASIGLLPLLATCDRWDLGGVSTALHVDTERATVFVYDAYPGGAGFAERGYELGAVWLRATRDAIAACPCADGCPACVQSPKCGSFNNPLDKAAAVRLLDEVLAYAPRDGRDSDA